MTTISISGTHSVGKTTLANQIVEAVPASKIKLITEIARILIAKGFKLNQDITRMENCQLCH